MYNFPPCKRIGKEKGNYEERGERERERKDREREKERDRCLIQRYRESQGGTQINIVITIPNVFKHEFK